MSRYTALWLVKLYPTPPSFLHHWHNPDWIGYHRVGWPSPQIRLAGKPLALGHHNHIVCSFACRWRWSWHAVKKSLFSIETPHLSLIVGPYVTAQRCPTPRIPSSMTWVPRSRMAFGHHRRVGWPLAITPEYSGWQTFGLWPSQSYSVQLCLPLAATLRRTKVFFYWNPPSILDSRAFSHSSELSYSYRMDHHLHPSRVQ